MRALDLTATQGKEPPQVKPEQYPGEYLELAVKDLVPVQKVRHVHKTIKATKQVKQGDYTPIVVDRNNRPCSKQSFFNIGPYIIVKILSIISNCCRCKKH